MSPSTKFDNISSKGMENQVPAQWRTKNRKVLLLDGSTLPLPDTKENREKFPPRKDQAKDMGTPIARVSVLTSLETGSVIDFEMSGWVGKGKGEFYLGRKLLENLSGQEILIGDAFYFSYFFFSLVREKNAEFVTRIKGNRKFIIKGEKRLAKGDRLILISKPRIPHTGWLDEATYEKVPNETILRETTVTLQKPGFRDKHITLISTLIHEKEFSAEDIADLYSQRWNIELDFRAIKHTMGLHALKCKKPSMALKEAWIHLLAYNLIRRTIQEAAINSGQKPRSISMNGAFLAFSSFKKPLSHPDMNLRRLIYHKMLACIASQQVGKRPGRLEPRARKKMAYYNDYPKLRISRNKWRLLTILPHLDLVLSSAAQEGIQKLQKRMPACNYNKYSVLC